MINEAAKYVSSINYIGPHQILTTGENSYNIAATIEGKIFTKAIIKEKRIIKMSENINIYNTKLNVFTQNQRHPYDMRPKS